VWVLSKLKVSANKILYFIGALALYSVKVLYVSYGWYVFYDAFSGSRLYSVSVRISE
jgi:hypothetical protein